MLRNRKTLIAVRFSSQRFDPVSVPENPPSVGQGLKATPASGFKIPKVKEGEEIIGRRVYGDTNIF
jgi:hypothetical protein